MKRKKEESRVIISMKDEPNKITRDLIGLLKHLDPAERAELAKRQEDELVDYLRDNVQAWGLDQGRILAGELGAEIVSNEFTDIDFLRVARSIRGEINPDKVQS